MKIKIPKKKFNPVKFSELTLAIKHYIYSLDNFGKLKKTALPEARDEENSK